MRHFQAAYVPDSLLAEWGKRYPPRRARLPVRPVPVHVYASSAPSVRRYGKGGRPLDEIPSAVIREIERYIRKHGEEPSSNWIYRRTRQMLPTGGFNRAKARRALELAWERLGQARSVR